MDAPTQEPQWFVATGGQVYGPVGEPQIRAWAVEGRLQLDWQVQPIGGDTWLSPSGVPELSDVMTSPPPPPPPVIGALAPGIVDDPAPPIGEMLQEGWELWQGHIVWGVWLMLCQGLLILVPTALPALALVVVPWHQWPTEPFDARWLVPVAAGVIYALIVPPVALGATTCAIDTARSRQSTLRPLLSGFRQWGSSFALMAALMLLSMLPYVGYLMIFATPVYTCLYWALADRQRGLIDAANHVASLMSRRYWWLFLILLIAGCIGFAGVLLLGVGLFFTGPLQYLMTSLVYLHLAGRQGWDASDRQPPTGGRLALEVIPMLLVSGLLVGGVVVTYTVFF